MRKKPSTPKRRLPFRTELTSLFVMDEFPHSGSLCDVDPFGTYHTGPDGNPTFSRVLRVNAGRARCPTPDSVDSLIARVLFASTKNSERHMAVSAGYVGSVLGRIPFETEPHILCGAIDAEKIKAAGLESSPLHKESSLPPSTMVLIGRSEPERLGRIGCWDGWYGFTLLNHCLIRSVEIVPPSFPFV